VLVVQEFPCHLGIRVDEVQKARIDAAAASAGVSMSEWCRDAIDKALAAEKASPPEPRKRPEKPSAQSPAVSRFLRAVEAANKRDRAFR